MVPKSKIECILVLADLWEKLLDLDGKLRVPGIKGMFVQHEYSGYIERAEFLDLLVGDLFVLWDSGITADIDLGENDCSFKPACVSIREAFQSFIIKCDKLRQKSEGGPLSRSEFDQVCDHHDSTMETANKSVKIVWTAFKAATK